MRKSSETVQKVKKPQGGFFWLARLQYYDSKGQRRNVSRSASSKNEAQDKLEELRQKYALNTIEHRDKTFAVLADQLKREHYTDAKYSDTGQKISGVRNPKKAHSIIKHLEHVFGSKKLSDITVSDLKRYRNERLQVARVSTVNRELSLMRAMFSIAVSENYIQKSPFDCARKGELINAAAENKRTVTITPEQEQALLAQCQTESRRHLRALIITLIDSGCRLGEVLNLRWSDINFADDYFVAVSFKGKNRTERRVPLTSRVRKVFLELRERKSLHSFRKDSIDEMSVFGIATNVRKSFVAARKAAGLDFLTLHDLRHTAATRLALSGMNIAHVGIILGHANIQTTKRYINESDAVVQQAREILERRA